MLKPSTQQYSIDGRQLYLLNDMWPFGFKWLASVSIRAQLFLPGGLCPVHSHRSWSCTQTFRKAWTRQSTSPGNPALEPSPAAQGLSIEDAKNGCGSGLMLVLPDARPPFSQRNISVSSLPEGVFALIHCESVLLIDCSYLLAAISARDFTQ